jgi:hypothetical protein
VRKKLKDMENVEALLSKTVAPGRCSMFMKNRIRWFRLWADKAGRIIREHGERDIKSIVRKRVLTKKSWVKETEIGVRLWSPSSSNESELPLQCQYWMTKGASLLKDC